MIIIVVLDDPESAAPRLLLQSRYTPKTSHIGTHPVLERWKNGCHTQRFVKYYVHAEGSQLIQIALGIERKSTLAARRCSLHAPFAKLEILTTERP